MGWTRNNSTNIDWVNYDGDGWCPDCDFCRDCGCGHYIGTRHKCEKGSFDTSAFLQAYKREFNEFLNALSRQADFEFYRDRVEVVPTEPASEETPYEGEWYTIYDPKTDP